MRGTADGSVPCTSMAYVNMPKPETFRSAEEYYSLPYHELTHSTGHSSRLNRKGITVHNGFGSLDYGKEELVAEMGAAFLCGCTGIENRVIDNSAAYVAGWLKAIKEDKKIVITAAAAAQKAADYILNKSEAGAVISRCLPYQEALIWTTKKMIEKIMEEVKDPELRDKL